MERGPGAPPEVNIVYHATQKPWQRSISTFHTNLQLSISGKLLDPADHYTYLGLTISGDMTWDAHLNHILAQDRSDAHLVSRLIQTENRPPYCAAGRARGGRGGRGRGAGAGQL